MPSLIVVDPALSPAAEDIVRHVAQHHVPGERVRIDPEIRYSTESREEREARRAAFAGKELTVAELRLDAEGNGGRLQYRFEEVPGLHRADGFQPAEGTEDVIGVIIHRGGETWVVPMAETDSPQVAGDPLRISPVLDRSGRWYLGLPDPMLEGIGYQPWRPDSSVERVYEGYEGRPFSGLFELVPLPDGSRKVNGHTWMAPALPAQVEAASEAVAEASAAPGPR